jgi:hypothetical protein
MPLKHFADTLEGPVELEKVRGLAFAEFEALFPGVKGLVHGDVRDRAVGLDPESPAALWDSATSRWVYNWLPVSRVVIYKKQPSRHECDARCTHATGRVMKCECSCGGKNHGRGGFVASAA